jgi:tetratricopeptide (TPR) repeat protein
MKDKAQSIALHIIIAAAISLILIWANIQYRQWSQYTTGEQALKRGDVIAAISAYDAAIHMYTPFSPLIERSAERLWQLGQAFEQRGERERALLAYRSLRSSFYAVRWLVSPGTGWIAKCDTRIASLVPPVQQAPQPRP